MVDHEGPRRHDPNVTKKPAKKAAKTAKKAAKSASRAAKKPPTKPSARDSQEAAQIGRWIQSLRTGGLGQKRPHVARVVGVSLATLQRWEKAVPVLWLQLRALARTLGVTADVLLNPPANPPQ